MDYSGHSAEGGGEAFNSREGEMDKKGSITTDRSMRLKFSCNKKFKHCMYRSIVGTFHMIQ